MIQDGWNQFLSLSDEMKIILMQWQCSKEKGLPNINH